MIRREDLPESFGRGPATTPAPAPRRTLRQLREEWLAPLETAWLRELLGSCGGRVRRAAREAGVDAVTMYRLLRRRGIEAGRRG